MHIGKRRHGRCRRVKFTSYLPALAECLPKWWTHSFHSFSTKPGSADEFSTLPLNRAIVFLCRKYHNEKYCGAWKDVSSNRSLREHKSLLLYYSELWSTGNLSFNMSLIIFWVRINKKTSRSKLQTREFSLQIWRFSTLSFTSVQDPGVGRQASYEY